MTGRRGLGTQDAQGLGRGDDSDAARPRLGIYVADLGLLVEPPGIEPAPEIALTRGNAERVDCINMLGACLSATLPML
jgi:hypothetical protein